MKGVLLKRGDKGLVRPYKPRWFVLDGTELRIYEKQSSPKPHACYNLTEIADPLLVSFSAPPKRLTGGRRASVACTVSVQDISNSRRPSAASTSGQQVRGRHGGLPPDPNDMAALAAAACAASTSQTSSSPAAAVPAETGRPKGKGSSTESLSASDSAQISGYYFEVRHPKQLLQLQAPSLLVRRQWTLALRAAVQGQVLSQAEIEQHTDTKNETLNSLFSASELSLAGAGERRHSFSELPEGFRPVRRYSRVEMNLGGADGSSRTIEIAVAAPETEVPEKITKHRPAGRKGRKISASTLLPSSSASSGLQAPARSRLPESDATSKVAAYLSPRSRAPAADQPSEILMASPSFSSQFPLVEGTEGFESIQLINSQALHVVSDLPSDLHESINQIRTAN